MARFRNTKRRTGRRRAVPLGRRLLLAGALLAAGGYAAAPAAAGPPPGPDPGPRAGIPPALVDAPPDALSRALADGTISEARYALERARALFRPGAVARRYGPVERADPRAATLVLRDLVARLAELSPRGRRAAERLLARPTDGAADPLGHGYTTAASSTCGPELCVHWVGSTVDAPPLDDADGDGIPDWVETARSVLADVWAAEVDGLGYRAPKSDLTSATNEGDGRLDVYLADVGAVGLYGYCTTDDPNADPSSTYGFYDFSAYCVLDEDFSPTQFRGTSGIAALRVTAAHELFHAVQAAYDFAEDAWLMEGTATWIEDEVFDAVNDNRQYLAESPLTQPGRPVDEGIGGAVYGAWIFFRFLSEYSGRPDSPDVAIVRRAWEHAAGAPEDPDLHSAAAVRTALADRELDFRRTFARFGAWNRAPGRTYSEGAAYPRAAPRQRYILGRLRPSTGWRVARPKHLANHAFAFTAGRTPRRAHVTLSVDLPAADTRPAATVIVVRRDGGRRTRAIALDRAGKGRIRVRFGRGTVKRVELVLTNASTRYDCWRGTPYACMGVPRDDGRRYSYRARLS